MVFVSMSACIWVATLSRKNTHTHGSLDFMYIEIEVNGGLDTIPGEFVGREGAQQQPRRQWQAGRQR